MSIKRNQHQYWTKNNYYVRAIWVKIPAKAQLIVENES